MEIKEEIKNKITSSINDDIEHIHIAYIKNNKLYVKDISGESSNSECSFSEYKMFNILWKNKIKDFYFIHTHPNSLALPSEVDKKLTFDILHSAKDNGYNLVDHFIYGPTDCFSFNESGFLYKKPDEMVFKMSKHTQNIINALNKMAVDLSK